MTRPNPLEFLPVIGRLIAVGLGLLATSGCVAQPTPWTPDSHTRAPGDVSDGSLGLGVDRSALDQRGQEDLTVSPTDTAFDGGGAADSTDAVAPSDHVGPGPDE